MPTLLDNLHRLVQIANNDLAVDIAIYAKKLGDTSQRQITIMRAIAESSTAPSQTDLVERTGIDRSTLAEIMRRLIKKGWVTRRCTKEDARAYAVRLTDEGTKALAAAKLCEARVERDLIKEHPLLAKVRDLDLSRIERKAMPTAPAPNKRQTYTSQPAAR